MKRRIKYCLILYAFIFFIYVSICVLSAVDRYELIFDWPTININFIKEYPNFEGAKY